MHIQNFDFAVSLLFFSGQLDITICYCVICFSLNLICENANDQPPNKMSGKTNRTHQLRNDNMLHQIYERIGFDWIQNAQYNRFGAEWVLRGYRVTITKRIWKAISYAKIATPPRVWFSLFLVLFLLLLFTMPIFCFFKRHKQIHDNNDLCLVMMMKWVRRCIFSCLCVRLFEIKTRPAKRKTR